MCNSQGKTFNTPCFYIPIFASIYIAICILFQKFFIATMKFIHSLNSTRPFFMLVSHFLILWKVVLISPHSSSIHQYPFFSQYNVLLCCRTAFGLLGRIPVVISGLCVLGSTSFPGQF